MIEPNSTETPVGCGGYTVRLTRDVEHWIPHGDTGWTVGTGDRMELVPATLRRSEVLAPVDPGHQRRIGGVVYRTGWIADADRVVCIEGVSDPETALAVLDDTARAAVVFQRLMMRERAEGLATLLAAADRYATMPAEEREREPGRSLRRMVAWQVLRTTGNITIDEIRSTLGLAPGTDIGYPPGESPAPPPLMLTPGDVIDRLGHLPAHLIGGRSWSWHDIEALSANRAAAPTPAVESGGPEER
ncbi:hypothetical protein [Nocardia cyriacigeorgica]|uniref:hypothetical protein n=1 Tax=Nocardia cyriacigeorgica TaxID=135487 RepID=UPI002454B3F6|nr:hypothetical protein [Nocardia cyriacigeorgica]